MEIFQKNVFILEYADFFRCKTSYGNTLLSADFLSITLFPPSSDVTLPVRQVSKLSCQPGFLRNLAGLLPAYLPSDLEICLKDSIKVGSASTFGILSSRKSPLNTLPQGNGPHGFQTPKPAGSSGMFIVIVEGALLSDPALQPDLQGLWGFLLGLGPPTQFMVWESYVHGPSVVSIMVLPESCDCPRSLALKQLAWLLLEIWKTCCVSRMK